MTSQFRRQALTAFKELHKARKVVFEGDEKALAVARSKINDEFIAKKTLTDEKAIQEQLKYAAEVKDVLRKMVIQAVQTDTGNYRIKMRDDIELLETASPYAAMPSHMIGPFKRKKPCGEGKS